MKLNKKVSVENSENIKISWHPGHMVKSQRQLQEHLKIVDVVAEIVDSRIPISSRNTDLNNIIKNRPKILIFNKVDISDVNETQKWLDFYRKNNTLCIGIDATKKNHAKKVTNYIKTSLNISKKAKIMVMGVPNVGKSSFIKLLSTSKKNIKIENRPGVTLHNQWYSVNENFDIFDTPGLLNPNVKNQFLYDNLAFTGAIKDESLDIQEIAVRLLDRLKIRYFDNICSRFRIVKSDINIENTEELLYEIGVKRGMYLKGGIIDMAKTATMLLKEFRMAKLGKITLESVDDLDKNKY